MSVVCHCMWTALSVVVILPERVAQEYWQLRSRSGSYGIVEQMTSTSLQIHAMIWSFTLIEDWCGAVLMEQSVMAWTRPKGHSGLASKSAHKRTWCHGDGQLHEVCAVNSRGCMYFLF